MVGWHHQLKGHEFEEALGDGEGQGNLACYSPWGGKGLDMTERLNGTELNYAVPGIFKARILKWVAVPFSRGSSQPRD